MSASSTVNMLHMDGTFVHCRHLDVDCSTIFWFWVEKYVYSEPVMSFRGTLSQKGGCMRCM